MQLFAVAIDLCVAQARGGGHFLLEHPRESPGWAMKSMGKLTNLKGVHRVEVDLCQHGLRARDVHGVTPVRRAISM